MQVIICGKRPVSVGQKNTRWLAKEVGEFPVDILYTIMLPTIPDNNSRLGQTFEVAQKDAEPALERYVIIVEGRKPVKATTPTPVDETSVKAILKAAQDRGDTLWCNVDGQWVDNTQSKFNFTQPASSYRFEKPEEAVTVSNPTNEMSWEEIDAIAI